MKRVFIDTNRYLDFYRASDHTLSILKALVELIKSGEIEVILPKQVLDEFIRDKELVFKDFVDKNLHPINVPGLLNGSKDIQNTNKKIMKIRADYEKKFFSNRSKVNILLNEVFSRAKMVQETEKILHLAHFRTIRGNPPRKNNRSFGDAIIWETLLAEFSDKDLVIISGDGDWSSEIDNKKVHPYLEAEWSRKTKNKLILSDSLGKVINELTKKEKINKKVIEEEKSIPRASTNDNSYIVGGASFANSLKGGFVIRNEGTFLTQSVANQGYFIRQNQDDQLIYNNAFRIDLPNTNSILYRANLQNCSCCRQSYDYDFSKVNPDRCEECQNIFLTGKTCKICGKHYHFDTMGALAFNNDCCPECGNNRAIAY